MGLVILSLVAVGAFLWIGFGPLPSTSIVKPTEFSPRGNPPDAGTRFRDVTRDVGLDSFRHDSGGLHSIAEAIAPGLGLLDLDADGDLDLVLLGGPGWETGVSVFLNMLREEGQLRFEDVTAEVGIRWRGHAQGVCAGDIDNDLDLDLFITAVGENLLLRNELHSVHPGTGQIVRGRLAFSDITRPAGVAGGRYHLVQDGTGAARVAEGPEPLASMKAVDDDSSEIPEFSTGASFGDYDLDGDLDLYVANYVSFHPDLRGDPGDGRLRDEEFEYQPQLFPAQLDRLYRNEGRGVFVEVSQSQGIHRNASRGLGAAFLQLNLDRFPDLYIANDEARNTLYANRRFGAADDFAEQPSPAMPLSSRGIGRGDVNGDGLLDLAISNWRGEPLSLLILGPREGSSENLDYSDEGSTRGVSETSALRVGWGTLLFDYDNDGDQDCMVACGGTSPASEDEATCSKEPLLLYCNLDGGHFAEVGASAGAALQAGYAARGLVCGDLDHDMDLDVVVAQNNGPVVVLRNELEVVQPRRNSLNVNPMLGGTRGDAVGTWVTLWAHDGSLQRHEVVSGGSFLSQNPLQVHFGIGEATSVAELQIRWAAREYASSRLLNVAAPSLIVRAGTERTAPTEEEN